MKITGPLALSLAFAESSTAFISTAILPTSRRHSINLNAATKPVDEAIAIFNKRYPPKGEFKPLFFTSWGVPATDIDGTPTSKSKNNKKVKSKRMFDINEAQIKAAFQELSKLYGAEAALQMSKDLPPVLAFDKKYFKPALAEFTKTFGVKEAKEMVMRNPGLLALKPEDAADADDQTMQFSYIIAKTRPAGPVLLYGTFALLMIPVIEGVTGTPFRANLFHSIVN
jgi:hypothetical protein